MKLKLIKKILEAKGTKSFFWEPEKTVGYLPGQYYYFTLPALKYPDPKGATRHITISSSPTEGNLLRLTTRIREESGYKKTLDGLPIGAEIEGEGPNGTFVLDQDPNWGSTGNINNYLSSANSSLKGKGYNTSTNADNIFIVNQSNVIGYFSWGSNDYNDHSYTINSIPGNMYVNGSIGETAVSTSARTFNSTNRNYGQSLAADLIHEGITGVKGYAYEPYTSAIANSNILLKLYTE